MSACYHMVCMEDTHGGQPLCELDLNTRHTQQCTGIYLGAGSLLQGVRGWPAGHAEGHTAGCALLRCSVGGGSGRGCGPGQAVACGGWRTAVACWLQRVLPAPCSSCLCVLACICLSPGHEVNSTFAHTDTSPGRREARGTQQLAVTHTANTC